MTKTSYRTEASGRNIAKSTFVHSCALNLLVVDLGEVSVELQLSILSAIRVCRTCLATGIEAT